MGYNIISLLNFSLILILCLVGKQSPSSLLPIIPCQSETNSFLHCEEIFQRESCEIFLLLFFFCWKFVFLPHILKVVLKLIEEYRCLFNKLISTPLDMCTCVRLVDGSFNRFMSNFMENLSSSIFNNSIIKFLNF